MKASRLIRRRIFGLAASYIFQLILLFALAGALAHWVPYYTVFTFILSFLFAIMIVNTYEEPEYKMSWLIIFLLFPIAGGILYFFVRNKNVFNRADREDNNAENDWYKYALDNQHVYDELEKANREAHHISHFIEDFSFNSPSTSTNSTYFGSGEKLYESLLEDLKNAEKYVFIEFYIVEKGKMLDGIVDILIEKAKQGVDVRFLMDDAGTILRLTRKDIDKLNKEGIKIQIFNPLSHKLSLKYNYRNHRKSLIIDGTVGYTGGINIGDNYINQDGRDYYWKDAGMRMEGEGVWGFTVMFLNLWQALSTEKIAIKEFYPDYTSYSPDISYGVVQPFTDNPLVQTQITESVYLKMIYYAKDYIYIKTPYLVLSKKILSALETAARTGVKIKIVTPGIPDKKIVYEVTRSYYQHLIDIGVEIYEYEPGFMHEKALIVDGIMGISGTVNLDFRSMYLSFECGVWLFKTESLHHMIEDFDEVFSVSTKISDDVAKSYSEGKRITHAVLRLFAPLM